MIEKKVYVGVAVSGRPGSGKSTVAKIITDALKAAGISVELQDEDCEIDRAEEWQARRIDELKKAGLEVIVKTRQLQRNPSSI